MAAAPEPYSAVPVRVGPHVTVRDPYWKNEANSTVSQTCTSPAEPKRDPSKGISADTSPGSHQSSEVKATNINACKDADEEKSEVLSGIGLGGVLRGPQVSALRESLVEHNANLRVSETQGGGICKASPESPVISSMVDLLTKDNATMLQTSEEELVGTELNSVPVLNSRTDTSIVSPKGGDKKDPSQKSRQMSDSKHVAPGFSVLTEDKAENVQGMTKEWTLVDPTSVGPTNTVFSSPATNPTHAESHPQSSELNSSENISANFPQVDSEKVEAPRLEQRDERTGCDAVCAPPPKARSSLAGEEVSPVCLGEDLSTPEGFENSTHQNTPVLLHRCTAAPESQQIPWPLMNPGVPQTPGAVPVEKQDKGLEHCTRFKESATMTVSTDCCPLSTRTCRDVEVQAVANVCSISVATSPRLFSLAVPSNLCGETIEELEVLAAVSQVNAGPKDTFQRVSDNALLAINVVVSEAGVQPLVNCHTCMGPSQLTSYQIIGQPEQVVMEGLCKSQNTDRFHPSDPAVQQQHGELESQCKEAGLPLYNVQAELPRCNFQAELPLCNVQAELPLCNVQAELPLCSLQAELPLCSLQAELPLCNVQAGLPPLQPVYQISLESSRQLEWTSRTDFHESGTPTMDLQLQSRSELQCGTQKMNDFSACDKTPASCQVLDDKVIVPIQSGRISTSMASSLQLNSTPQGVFPCVKIHESNAQQTILENNLEIPLVLTQDKDTEKKTGSHKDTSVKRLDQTTFKSSRQGACLVENVVKADRGTREVKQRKSQALPNVVWDEQGMTWEVYGASVDPESLGFAIQSHLQSKIKEHERKITAIRKSICSESSQVKKTRKHPRNVFRSLLRRVRRPQCCVRPPPSSVLE